MPRNGNEKQGSLSPSNQNRLATRLLGAMLTPLVVGMCGRLGTATTLFARVIMKLVLVSMCKLCMATWKFLGVFRSPGLLEKSHRAPVT